jgi:hypothetical protein
MTDATAWLRFSLAALATWRLTHLLANEDGPWNLISRLRNRAGNGLWGGLLDCFYCLSLWISAGVTFFLGPPLRDWILVWLALSGAACLLDRIGRDPVVIRPLPAENVQGDSDNVVLRS